MCIRDRLKKTPAKSAPPKRRVVGKKPPVKGRKPEKHRGASESEEGGPDESEHEDEEGEDEEGDEDEQGEDEGDDAGEEQSENEAPVEPGAAARDVPNVRFADDWAERYGFEMDAMFPQRRMRELNRRTVEVAGPSSRGAARAERQSVGWRDVSSRLPVGSRELSLSLIHI